MIYTLLQKKVYDTSVTRIPVFTVITLQSIGVFVYLS